MATWLFIATFPPAAGRPYQTSITADPYHFPPMHSTMPMVYWSGPILLAFVIYHLLDFTFGRVNPNFLEGDVYHNVLASFGNPIISIWYIFSMLLLALHLRHGAWSMFQSLGVAHPRYNAFLKKAAIVFAAVIFFGFISVPLGVMTGWVK